MYVNIYMYTCMYARGFAQDECKGWKDDTYIHLGKGARVGERHIYLHIVWMCIFICTYIHYCIQMYNVQMYPELFGEGSGLRSGQGGGIWLGMRGGTKNVKYERTMATAPSEAAVSLRAMDALVTKLSPRTQFSRLEHDPWCDWFWKPKRATSSPHVLNLLSPRNKIIEHVPI